MREIRIYIINGKETDKVDYLNLNDEQFMEYAEAQGNMYSLEGFVEQFNEGSLQLNDNWDFIRKIEVQTEAFHITSVSRDDLKHQGFSISEVTDHQMQRIADKMSDDYCEQLYWGSLDIIAETVGVAKL